MGERRVSFGDGKYTVVVREDGGLRVQGYGEEWRDLVGDGLVLALVQEIEALRARMPRAVWGLRSASLQWLVDAHSKRVAWDTPAEAQAYLDRVSSKVHGPDEWQRCGGSELTPTVFIASPEHYVLGGG